MKKKCICYNPPPPVRIDPGFQIYVREAARRVWVPAATREAGVERGGGL